MPAKPHPVDLVEDEVPDNNGSETNPPPAPRIEKPPKDDVRVNLQGPMSSVINSVGRLSAGIPGIGRRQMSAVQYLADVVNDSDKVGYMLEIRRTGPAVWDGVELPAGTIHRCPPMSYPELYDRIRQLHGGGEYRIMIMDENGVTKQQLPFRIETVTEPPKLTKPQSFTSLTSNPMRPVPLSNAALEEEETSRLRQEERRLAGQMSVEEKKRELEQRRKAYREEERRERELEEKKATSPILEAQHRMHELESKMLQMNSSKDSEMMKMMLMMQESNKQMLATIMTSNRPDNKEDKMFPLMMQMMQSNQQQMMQFMTLMMDSNKTKASELTEAAKISADANTKIMDMAVKSASGGNARYDKLIEAMVSQKIAQPENSVKQALELIETGRKQTMEMFELRESMGSNDDMEYDPEAGAMGNLGKIIFGLLRSLVKGGGGLGGLATALAAMGKSDASQVSQRDLMDMARQLEANAPQQLAQLQAPQSNLQQIQRMPQPVMQPIITPAPRMPNIMQPIVVQPAPTMQQPIQQAPVQKLPIVEGVFEDDELTKLEETLDNGMPVQVETEVTQTQVTTVMPVAVPMVQDGDTEERLKVWISEAMRIAVEEDLKDGRKEHEWPETALNKWNKPFLDLLVQASDDAARLQLIAARCDKMVFDNLQMKLLDQTQPHNYRNFIDALHNLIQEHASVNNLAVPTV